MASITFSKRYRTLLVFLTGLLISAGAVAAALVMPDIGFWFLLPAAGVDVLLLRYNDTRGFSRSKEMHRADDPPRHFNLFQVIVLYMVALALVVLFFYLISV